MTYDQRPQARAESQENEPILVVRVVRIGDQKCLLVQEYRFGLGERHTVLARVCHVLAFVPDELKISHRNAFRPQLSAISYQLSAIAYQLRHHYIRFRPLRA